MGGCRQLETPGIDPGTQRGMGAIGPGHHNSNIGHLEQRQIVGGIPQGQDLHLLSTQMSRLRVASALPLLMSGPSR